MSVPIIRPIGADERAAWEPLWLGYLTFYKTTRTPEVTVTAWRRMHDPNEPMHGLGAYVEWRGGTPRRVFRSDANKIRAYRRQAGGSATLVPRAA